MTETDRWTECLQSGMDGTLHATAVALRGRAVLLLGPSGSGKSSLALQMMAYGARLVADDRVIVARDGERVRLSAPVALRGRIEARGVGIISARPAKAAELVLVADLGRAEPHRLPPQRSIGLLGRRFPLVLGAGNPHLGPALLQLLRCSDEESGDDRSG